MKKLIYLMGLGAIGYVAYRYVYLAYFAADAGVVVTPSTDQGAGVTSALVQDGSTSTQPSQLFPYADSQAPRADNADQPWYGGSLTFADFLSGSSNPSTTLGSDQTGVGYNSFTGQAESFNALYAK